ncbi:MAG: L-threonylcarbamoyladenylate synthase [Pelagimonas sp.]|jgi:L-threonylcarbamoyladenylate synthase|nr:L-threonylcarbamoyladenylate synthase [Pelagimonas sp.]
MAEISTQNLGSGDQDIAQAATILRQGGLVAFPTETVYGLGADASNDTAVARIYAAKGRPSFNPLIVHVADIQAAKRLVIWSDAADQVAQAVWPGPLTMVLPLRPDATVSKLVSAGLSTLAIRVPDAPLARDLLRAFDGGIAAPSANRSGRISPTLAAHVQADLTGRIDAILDGGACSVGVESTILGLKDRPTLLRPGGITVEQLTQILGQPIALRHDDDGITAPGQTLSHYAPRAAVRLNAQTWHDGEARLGFGPVACDLNLSEQGDLIEAAANLFAHLHALDKGGAAHIAVSPIPNTGLGAAINDRLIRAAADR